MTSPVISEEGRSAEGDLREWAFKLVGGGRLRREPSFDFKVGAGSTGKLSRPAGRDSCDGVKPYIPRRENLVPEREVPPSILVKLEPLKEP
jgi:hypothetical protein